MSIIFPFPGYENLTDRIKKHLNLESGEAIIREFPDKESFVKIVSNVENKDVIVVCGLDNPNQKIMALMFFSNLAKELKAKSVGLIAPYLGYMRQDKRFHEGEAITSNIFAKFLSKQVDWMVTIDPHLHRHKSLQEIYSIPTSVLHATDPIADWIKANVKNPLLIGPDEESRQWVEEITKKISAPFVILTKTRLGDKEVKISLPNIENYRNHTPVLVDDIISTARTMIETVKLLQKEKTPAPFCIGVHAIFAEDSYELLKTCGTAKIVTCNTIPHTSNQIDLSKIITQNLPPFLIPNS